MDNGICWLVVHLDVIGVTRSVCMTTVEEE